MNENSGEDLVGRPPGPQPPPGTVPPKRPRRWWLVILAAIVFAASMYLFSPKGSAKTGATPAGKGQDGKGKGKGGRGGGGAPNVVATRAHTGDVGIYFTGLGTVTPIYTVMLKSRVDGELIKVTYHEGDLVHKGDLLL